MVNAGVDHRRGCHSNRVYDSRMQRPDLAEILLPSWATTSLEGLGVNGSMHA
jgi:hypothetical protein